MSEIKQIKIGVAEPCPLKNNCNGNCNPLGVPCYLHKQIDKMDNIKQINTGVADIIALKVPDGAHNFPHNCTVILDFKINNSWNSINLPPGNWTPLGLSDQLTEEQARVLLITDSLGWYKDYSAPHDWFMNVTAKEAFTSLMQANGCYSVNPYGSNDYAEYVLNDAPLESPLYNQWQQAEANTGTWLILKKTINP